MKRVFDSPFLNKAALVLIWLLLMGGTFFYANKNYFLYHENPNLIKADGYYLYNFGSPRHYYWALPVKFTHEGKVYHSQLPLDIRDESSSCTVDLRIYIPADSSGSAFAFRNNITIPALWRIFIFVPLLLLLTSKRAHLLFGVATLIVVYYVVNPEKRLLKSFKLMMAAVAALIGLNFLMDYVPDIARVFERFQTAGSDNASLLRILMWDRARSIFNQNPILGIGWYGFRYKSGLSTLTGATAGCHNIYLELLCETGLLGFCVFIMAMASSIVITWKNINFLSHPERDVELTSIKLALSVSFAIQFFVLLYGMTGNPIYDSTFCFYAVAVAINISFTSNMRGRI